jgi:glycosyltransferase involved in cell wall biosynthesis
MIVTMATPGLNGRYYFRGPIRSVKEAAKSRITIEHLINDSGSTDGPLELAEAAGLRVLKEPDTGLTGRLNVGYRAAKGEQIGFLRAVFEGLPAGEGTGITAVWCKVFARGRAAIREPFGMSNGLNRSFCRYTMKAWAHLSNPRWRAGKLIERARLDLGMAQGSHYK